MVVENEWVIEIFFFFCIQKLIIWLVEWGRRKIKGRHLKQVSDEWWVEETSDHIYQIKNSPKYNIFGCNEYSRLIFTQFFFLKKRSLTLAYFIVLKF